MEDVKVEVEETVTPLLTDAEITQLDLFGEAAPVEAATVEAAPVEVAPVEVPAEVAVEVAPVETPVTPEKPTKGKKATAAAALEVSHNGLLLDWPTDVWGFTRELKAALIATASSCRGSPDKKAILDRVMAIGLAHIDAKYKNDVASKDL